MVICCVFRLSYKDHGTVKNGPQEQEVTHREVGSDPFPNKKSNLGYAGLRSAQNRPE